MIRMLLTLAVCVAAATGCGSDDDSAETPSATPASVPVPLATTAVLDSVIAIDQQRIEQHIEEIAVPRNPFAEPEALARVGDYIDGEFASYGLTVERRDATLDGVTSPNIIGVLEGTLCPERIAIIGAHYDSVPESPAAVDNASGVAGVLEIARVLADKPQPATVWFVAFTLEENGLAGSEALADQLRSDDAEVVSMLSLDLIGYTTPDARFIIFQANDQAADLVASFERVRLEHIPDLEAAAFTVGNYPDILEGFQHSDHAPFWRAGYNAAQVTNTAERMPYIHTPQDKPDTVDLAFNTNVARATLAHTIDFLNLDDDASSMADVCE